MGDANLRLKALISGASDSAMLSPPAITIAAEKGLNPIMDLGAAKVPWVFAGIAARKSYLDKNQDTLKTFLMATLEGVRFALDNREWAVKALSGLLKTSDQKLLNAAYDDYIKFTERNFAVPADAAENVIKTMNDVSPLKQTDLKYFIDDRIAREVQ